MNEENTLYLVDEDGEEIELDVYDKITYKGIEYLVTVAEDTGDIVFLFERDGEYIALFEGEAYDYLTNEVNKGLRQVIDLVNTKFEVDELLDKCDSLIGLCEDALNDNDDHDDVDDTNDASENSCIPTTNEDVNEAILHDTIDKLDEEVMMFDSDLYISQTQDYSFKAAINAYICGRYEEALKLFRDSVSEGNIFASARIGIMYHYGEGCIQSDDMAYEAFCKGAELGCPLAAAWRAECYRIGCGVRKDEDYARSLRRSCDSGLKDMCRVEDMSALYFLGYDLLYGLSGETNDDEAFRLLELAVFKGEPHARVSLAECYIHGWGTEEAPEKAVELLENCQQPLKRKALYLLGYCYYCGAGTEKDYSKAFDYFLMSAQKGYGKAKDYLGDCYYYGHGTNVDFTEAAKWYKDAVDNHGIGASAYNLAFMYLHGEGVEENEKTAIDYFLIAAQKGIIPAQRIISKEYLSGRILGQDYEEARKWIEKAAMKGDSEAQLELGRFYFSDLGFKDEKKGFEWVAKAAEQGNAEAEYIVGGCYQYAIGVDEDPVQADTWFSKAADNGHSRAQYELGHNLIDGHGNRKDVTRGVELLKSAADANIREASKELADLFFLGVENYQGQRKYTNPSEAQKYAKIAVQDDKDGAAQYRLATILHISFDNPSAATEWYIRAAENGNDDAKLALAKLYLNNHANYNKALDMLRELANKNSGEAQHYLAVCYENGYGCQIDKKGAKYYYQLAASNGFVGNNQPKKRKFGFF